MISFWNKCTIRIKEVFDAYSYLYKCNENSHFRTMKQMLSAVFDYRRHRRLDCSIQKIKHHVYQINYTIGPHNHQIMVHIPKGPKTEDKKPNLISDY